MHHAVTGVGHLRISRRRGRPLIALIVLALSVLGVPPVSAQQAVAPAAQLAGTAVPAAVTGPRVTVRGQGMAGALVTLVGQGFRAGSILQASWDRPAIRLRFIWVNRRGNFTARIRIPAGAASGTHSLLLGRVSATVVRSSRTSTKLVASRTITRVRVPVRPRPTPTPTPTPAPNPTAPTPTPAATSAPGTVVENVRDFGARGDGSTNDTRAFAAAVAAVKTAGGGSVFVPVGKYLVSQIRLSSGVTLEGESRTGTTIQQSGVSGTQFQSDNATVYFSATDGGGLDNLTIQGTNGAGHELLLVLDGATNGRFTRLTVDQASGRGIFLAAFVSATTGNLFDDVRVTNTKLTATNTRGESLWLYSGASHNTFVNVSLEGGATKGLSLDAGSYTGPFGVVEYNYFKNLSVIDMGQAGTWTAAIDLAGASHNRFDGFAVEWTTDPAQADSALYVTEDQNVIPSDYNLFEHGTLTNLPGRAFDLLSSNHNTFRSITIHNVERVWDFAGQGNLVSLGWGFFLNRDVPAGSCSDNVFDTITLTQSASKTHYQYGVLMSPGDAKHADQIEIMRNSFVNIMWAGPMTGGYRIVNGTNMKAPSTGSDTNTGLPVH